MNIAPVECMADGKFHHSFLSSKLQLPNPEDDNDDDDDDVPLGYDPQYEPPADAPTDYPTPPVWDNPFAPNIESLNILTEGGEIDENPQPQPQPQPQKSKMPQQSTIISDTL